MSNIVSPQSIRFSLADGFRPATQGTLYIGRAGTDPTITANQLVVTGRKKDGTSVTLTQPISLSAVGDPVDVSGNPVDLLVDTHYSFAAFDYYGKLQNTASYNAIDEVSSIVLLRALPVLREGQMVTLSGNSGGRFVGSFTVTPDDGVNTISSSTWSWLRVQFPFSNGKPNGSKLRTQTDKLRDVPCLLDWDSDSLNDDTSRFSKAISDGVESLYLPGRKEYGKVITVGELNIPTVLRLFGNGSQSFNAAGSVIKKASSAAFGLHFNGVGQSTRPAGGGLFDVFLAGETSSDTGPLVKVTSWSYFKAVNVGFNAISDYGIRLKDTMESSILYCLFRRLGSNDTGCILIDDYLDVNTSNVNNLHIEGNTFAYSSGAWIRASGASNTDLLWIKDNKFEYDGTPISANTDPQYIIDLGQIARAMIVNNGFAYHQPSLNNYAGILRMGTGSTAKTVFEGNAAFGCEGNFWNVQAGTIRTRSNYNTQTSTSSAITQVCTSSRRHEIENPINQHSNGNLSTGLPKEPVGFISAHDLSGTIAGTFVADSDAMRQTTFSAAAGNEIRRLQLPKYLMDGKTVVNVTLRVKCANSAGADGQVTVVVDSTTIQAQSVTAVSGWVNLKFVIKVNQIGTGSVRVNNTGTVPLLFDGLVMEKAAYIDWNFAFSPGTLAVGGTATSANQSPVDFAGVTGIVRGTSSPWFDQPSTGFGAFVNTQSSGQTGSFTVTLLNVSGTSLTPTVTRCYIRVFLF